MNRQKATCYPGTLVAIVKDYFIGDEGQFKGFPGFAQGMAEVYWKADT